MSLPAIYIQRDERFMDINSATGGVLLADYDLSDVASHVEDNGVFPIEVYREIRSHLSVADTAKFAQLRATMVDAFRMAAVSDVFRLLQQHSKSVGMTAAVDAMPLLPPRERMALLYAMIGWSIRNDYWRVGLRSERLASVLEETLLSLSEERNIDYQNEGKQLYLLAKCARTRALSSTSSATDLPLLLIAINDLPVRYRGKIVDALSTDLWYLGSVRRANAFFTDSGKEHHLLDASYQRLLDHADCLDRPVSI